VSAGDSYGASGAIITPEAVVLDFHLAGLGSRALAYTVDLMVQLGALMVVLTAGGAVAIASETAGIVVMLIGLIAVVVLYSTLLETFNNGRTLGRMIVKTRVVTVEGAPVRFRHAFIRALLAIVDLILSAGMIATMSSLVTRRGQRLGDMVAGTMVIREPEQVMHAGSIRFWAPTYLAAWANTVDTRGLGNDGYQIVREFVTRDALVEPARTQVADQVSAFVSERLPHAARPATVPSWDYLTAIATAAQSGGPNAAPPPPPSRWQQPNENTRYAAPAMPDAPPTAGTPFRRPVAPQTPAQPFQAPSSDQESPATAPVFEAPSAFEPPYVPQDARPETPAAAPLQPQPLQQPVQDTPPEPLGGGFAAPG